MTDHRVRNLAALNQNVIKGQTLFTGSSLMEQFPINELRMTEGIETIIYNRGIGGFTTDDMLESMEEMVYGTEPSRIFINIGTNDIANPKKTLDDLIDNYRKILQGIRSRLPACEVFLMAYYPVNETELLPPEEAAQVFETRTNENIRKANQRVRALALEFGYHFIDVNDGLADENGRLKKEYTIEGIHLYADAYRIVLNNLKPYL